MSKQKTNRRSVQTRAHARAVTISRRGYEKIYESDSTYFLKLVIFVLLGTFWLKLAEPVVWLGIPIGGVPVGLLLGLVLVRKFEKLQSDRKIWYAILLVVTIISHFVPAGIVI